MNFYRRLSFKARLLMISCFTATLTAIAGFAGYYGLHVVEAEYGQITENSLPDLMQFSSMDANFLSVRVRLRTLGLPGLTNEEADKAIEEAQYYINLFNDGAKAYSSGNFIQGEEALYKEVDKNWKSFEKLGERVVYLHRQGTPEAKAEMLNLFRKDCPEISNQVNASILTLMNFHRDNAKAYVASAHHVVTMTEQSLLWLSVVGIFFGLGAGYLFAVTLSRTISRIAHELDENSAHVSSASSQIASSSQELSQASAEQASSLEETAASLEEITSMVAKNNENAKNTSNTATESQRKASEGKEAMERMLQSMADIDHSNNAIMTQVNHSNEQMAEIAKVIQEIGQKTKVINDIVFQTKLLSFNASVEAARAGEHGKGFAVVAEEVGNLARMSGNAAKEISDMLEDSISKVDGIIRETKSTIESLISEGKEKVNMGSHVAQQCSDVLNEIVDKVGSASRMAGEITVASQEQSLGIAEINKAMSQLDTVTHQNAGTSEETARAAEQLSHEAHSLKHAVDELVEVVMGAGRSKPLPTSKPAGKSAAAKKDNVVALKTGQKKSQKPAPSTKTALAATGTDGSVQSASGQWNVPDGNHSGFQDF